MSDTSGTFWSDISSQKVKVDNANIYVQGQNLFTITEYEGIDPETGAFGLPPLRLIITGVQLTF